MENITILLNHLRTHGWHMTSFIFRYNGYEYIVLFEDITNLHLKTNGYDVLLTFIDTNDEERRLSVRAKEQCFEFKVREFREFFHIAYSENLGDIFKQFYAYFNRFVPLEVRQPANEQEKMLIINRLNANDNDNNTCCYAVKRNPEVNGKQYHRSPFNAQKCRMLKADLYHHFENEDTISFCFRARDELSTTEILKHFAEQEQRLQRGNW